MKMKVKAVTYLLARRYGIKTVDDILRHFYFNRECCAVLCCAVLMVLLIKLLFDFGPT
jgi:hypothetical protein